MVYFAVSCRSETLTEDTLESITQELGERDFLPPGRHFSIRIPDTTLRQHSLSLCDDPLSFSVISEEGNKTEVRTGSELLDAAKVIITPALDFSGH